MAADRGQLGGRAGRLTRLALASPHPPGMQPAASGVASGFWEWPLATGHSRPITAPGQAARTFPGSLSDLQRVRPCAWEQESSPNGPTQRGDYLSHTICSSRMS